METITRSNQISHIDATPKIGSPADIRLEALLNSIDTNFDSPLRLYAAQTPDSKLYISSNKVISSDGSGKSVPPIKKLIPDFPASTIDFQTGAVTGGTVDIVMPTTTSGQFRRVGFTLISGGILKAIFSDAALSLGALQDPGNLFVSGGVPAGWVDLESTGTTTYKTAGSSSSIIENSVGGSARIHRIASGGGAGDSTAGESQLVADGFKAVVVDDFTEFPNSDLSKVNPVITNATFDVAREMYSLKCDKSLLLTTNGITTSFSLNAAPSGFTLSPGDIIYRNGVWRRVASFSGLSGTFDAVWSGSVSNLSCMVSQAVHSVDLVNYGDTLQQTRLRDFFPATPINQINIAYDDSYISNDDVPDFVNQARVVVSASNSGLQSHTSLPDSNTFSPIFERPVAPNQISNYPLLANVDKERLFLTFFCNPNNGTVTTGANVLKYECSVYEKQVLLSGGILWSSVCWSDSSVAPINCSNPTLFSGKSRITFTNPYVPNIGGPGAGELEVIVDGQNIPRQYPGVVGAYYIEVDPFTIDLWTDVSGASPNLSIHVKRKVGSVDTSSVNTLRLNALYDAVIGSITQVIDGSATHEYSDIQLAIDSVPSGGSILILKGVCSANFNLDKSVNLIGQGHGTNLTGTITSTGSFTNSLIKELRLSGASATISGNYNMISVWLSGGCSLVDSGVDNLKSFIVQP